jgi:hypothetical protein
MTTESHTIRPLQRVQRGTYIATTRAGGVSWRITHRRRPPYYLPLWHVDPSIGPGMYATTSEAQFDTLAEARRYLEEWSR